MKIAGVVLAGGRGQRLGADKGLVLLGSRPLAVHVADRLRPQVHRVVLNANGDPQRFASTGLEVVPDATEDFAGPMAGILAGIGWARGNDFTHIATAATDTPFFPMDFVARLARDTDERAIAVARSGGRPHPTFSLWPVSAGEAIRAFLASGEKASVLRFVEARMHRFVDFAPSSPGRATHDPFFNINTPADLAEARRLLADLEI